MFSLREHFIVLNAKESIYSGWTAKKAAGIPVFFYYIYYSVYCIFPPHPPFSAQVARWHENKYTKE